MSKQPLPRFRADIQVVVDISAADYDDAEERLSRVAREIESRLSKTTFERLPGKPKVDYVGALEPSIN